MAATRKLSIGKIISRYAVSVLFPTFAASTIYLDWNHTQQWKLAQKEKQSELLKV